MTTTRVLRSIYLDPEVDQALAVRATAEDTTKAELVRRFVAEGLAIPARASAPVGDLERTVAAQYEKLSAMIAALRDNPPVPKGAHRDDVFVISPFTGNRALLKVKHKTKGQGGSKGPTPLGHRDRLIFVTERQPAQPLDQAKVELASPGSTEQIEQAASQNSVVLADADALGMSAAKFIKGMEHSNHPALVVKALPLRPGREEGIQVVASTGESGLVEAVERILCP